jgi:hypothetical protein
MVGFKVIITFIFLIPSLAFCEDIYQIQVKNFKEEKWERFFGVAQAYRKIWWQNNPDSDLAVLETLALLKHCRYQDAYRLTNNLEDSAEKVRLLNLLPGLEKLKIENQAGQSKSKTSTKNQWRFNNDKSSTNMLKIPISTFRSKIINLCEN